MSSIFALDIGEKYVKGVESDTDKKNIKVKTAFIAEHNINIYKNSADEVVGQMASFINKLVIDAKFTKKEVNIIIPDNQSYSRIFEMPLLTDKELISAIRYQADQFIPIPIDKVNLDVYTLEKDKKNNNSRILLIAAATATIDTLVKVVETAELIPQSIENETSAILRFIAKLDEFSPPLRKGVAVDPGTDIYINFGYFSTSIIVYCVDKKMPLQSHNFPIGLELFKRDVKANYNVEDSQILDIFQKEGFINHQTGPDLNTVLSSPLNEFANEVNRFMGSIKNVLTGRVLHTYLYGEGVQILGMDQKLSSLLGTPVTIYNPVGTLVPSQIVDYYKAAWHMFIPALGGSFR